MASKPLIGILALQGNFTAHASMLQNLQVATMLVKEPHQLHAIDGLIIPGGESTVIIKQLVQNMNWQSALSNIKDKQLPILGTCAGLILLSKKVEPEQFSLGWLDVEVVRNGYGRQIDSHVACAIFNFNSVPHSIKMPLIRAPKIIKVGSAVVPLIVKAKQIYLVEQETLLAATFHPEITSQTYVHQYFLQKVYAYIKNRRLKL